MKFTLTYQGMLKPNGPSAEKQKVRNALSRQHDSLWNHGNFKLDESELLGDEVKSIHGRQFIPLISRRSELRVSLDVLLLQHSTGQSPLGDHGDIDNRLKTLLDGLRVPQNEKEAGNSEAYEFDGPVYCLVEDDALIEKVTLEIERWYEPQKSPNDVLAILKVTTRVNKVTWGNLNHLA